MLRSEFQACLADMMVELSQELQNGEVLRGNPGVSRKTFMLLLFQGSHRLEAKSRLSPGC